MDKRDPILKLWRDRLAKNARTFRKLQGRWPGGITYVEQKDTLDRIKHSIETAALAGVKPPYIH